VLIFLAYGFSDEIFQMENLENFFFYVLKIGSDFLGMMKIFPQKLATD
jgi:hypothetical protein